MITRPIPEKQNPVQSTIDRVTRARMMFEKNFHDDGRPKNKEGRKLYKRYYVPDYGEVYSYRLPLWRRVRGKFRRARLIVEEWFLFFFGSKVCAECAEPIEGLSIGTSINRRFPQHYHQPCFKEVYGDCTHKK